MHVMKGISYTSTAAKVKKIVVGRTAVMKNDGEHNAG
jgi:hypothetical protein